MLENIKEPLCFNDVLQLQLIHEEEVNKPRKDGFLPRSKKYVDLRAATMDEFLEFRKELPYDLNFKTWKNKNYSAEKQLEEFVDILFFIATEINLSRLQNNSVCEWDYCWKYYHSNANIDSSDLHFFMRNIVEENIIDLLKKYILLAKRLKYSENDILQQYWKKWQHNLNNRIEGDWSHEKN